MQGSDNNIFIEIGSMQKNKHGNLVCGDTFLFKKNTMEDRYIMALSDGLGSGVKANVLSTMTASMGVNFSIRREPIERTARTIMNTLPVDSVRNISYSTFSIVDIEGDGQVQIAEYDNPPFLFIRDGKSLSVPQKKISIAAEEGSNVTTKRIIRIAEMSLKKEDRLIFFSDGVTQSGLGNRNMPFGWGEAGIAEYAERLIASNATISARDLAKQIVYRAEINDFSKLKDDTSCVVVYVREPRRLLICTGPPYSETKDKYLSDIVKDYKGKKVICGGTTSLIISRELNRSIEVGLNLRATDLPPASKMAGIDLVTEGIITLGSVQEMLREYSGNETQGEGPAFDIFRLFMESDIINFVVGTKINEAHQDPALPVELEIRRNVIKQIKKVLEEKFLKEVDIQFI